MEASEECINTRCHVFKKNPLYINITLIKVLSFKTFIKHFNSSFDTCFDFASRCKEDSRRQFHTPVYFPCSSSDPICAPSFPLSLHQLQRDGIVAKVSSVFHSLLPEMLSGRVEEVTLPRQQCDPAHRRPLTCISRRRSSLAPPPLPVVDAKSVRLHGHESNKRHRLSAG